MTLCIVVLLCSGIEKKKLIFIDFQYNFSTPKVALDFHYIILSTEKN
jgi:hypothetical protein